MLPRANASSIVKANKASSIPYFCIEPVSLVTVLKPTRLMSTKSPMTRRMVVNTGHSVISEPVMMLAMMATLTIATTSSTTSSPMSVWPSCVLSCLVSESVRATIAVLAIAMTVPITTVVYMSQPKTRLAP